MKKLLDRCCLVYVKAMTLFGKICIKLLGLGLLMSFVVFGFGVTGCVVPATGDIDEQGTTQHIAICQLRCESYMPTDEWICYDLSDELILVDHVFSRCISLDGPNERSCTREHNGNAVTGKMLQCMHDETGRNPNDEPYAGCVKLNDNAGISEWCCSACFDEFIAD